MDKKDYIALARFRHALREFLHFSEEAARSVHLTPQQHQALLAIRGFPERDEVTIGELANSLQIRPHSAVGLVDRLVSHDLVQRLHREGDRRQVYVALTPKGSDILDQLSAAHRAELSRLGEHLVALLPNQEGNALDRK